MHYKRSVSPSEVISALKANFLNACGMYDTALKGQTQSVVMTCNFHHPVFPTEARSIPSDCKLNEQNSDFSK